MLVVFSFSYSSSNLKDVSARGLFLNGDVIKVSGSSSVEFEINEITIKRNGGGGHKNDYFTISGVEDSNQAKNKFIQVTGLKIIRVDLGREVPNGVAFSDSDTIKFALSGKLTFNWPIYNTNPDFNIIIGYRAKNDEVNKNPIPLNLKSDIEVVTPLNLKVAEDMNLGKGIAGNALDTSRGDGHPAKIEATGERGKNVKFKIINPNDIKITNSKGNSLNVNVWFEENKQVELVRNLREKSTGNSLYEGKVSDIKIHGRCQSEPTSRGKYTGSFTVRVEYND